MKMDVAQSMIVRVTIKKQETLFLAQSPDMPGLLVSARDSAAALEKVPAAIEAILGFHGTKYIAFSANTGTPGNHTFIAVPAGVAKKALERVTETA